MEKNKKILIFSLAYKPFWGGAEVAIGNITKRLPDYDWQMITVNLDGRQNEEEQVGNIKVYRLGHGKLDKYCFPWLAYKKAKELQAQNNYDLIWAMMANQAGWAAKKFKKKFPNIPYLLTLQEGDSLWDIWLRTWFMRPLYKNIYRCADYIQAISSYLANRAEKLGVSKKIIKIVPNGARFQKIKNEDKIKREYFNYNQFVNYNNLSEINSNIRKLIAINQKNNLNNGDKLVITISRLVKKNGIEYLIKAMKYLPNNYKLRIIGDGKLESKLKKLVKKLNLNSRVFFYGNVNYKKLWKYFQWKERVFVRPSLTEGLGNVFFEAMLLQTPVIATPVGGIPDFLKDGETGWFCKAKNPKSIADKILYVTDKKNKEEVQNVVSNALNMIKKDYDWKNVAEKLNTIFVQLSKPKILVATGIYPPDIGGPATMIGQLVGDLRVKFDVPVITYTSQDKKEVINQVIFIPKGRVFSRLRYLWEMLRLSKRAQIIYVTDVYSVGYFAYLIKKFTGRKYIVRFAGDSAWETATANGWTTDYITDFEKKKYRWRIERLKSRRRKILLDADKIIAVSKFMGSLAELIGVNPDKIKVIYNSVDFLYNPVYSKTPEDLMPSDGKVIMTACRLTKWKGVDLLIKALKSIQASGKTYLVIIGDGPEMINLKKMAQDEGVSDLVIFKGRVPHDMVLYYYRQADVFVLNTNYEGLSHTLLEAIKAEAPIVATSVGGNPEVIEDGKSGLLVEYGNQKQLAEAIIKVLQDGKLAEEFVANAAKRLPDFSWAKTITQTAEVIRDLL